MPHPQPRFVSHQRLCEIFNDLQCDDQVRTGHLELRVWKNNHLPSEEAHVPPCTYSQYIVYQDRHGRQLARAHRYLQPDGTLGASGRPDPKEVRLGQLLYMVDPNDS